MATNRSNNSNVEADRYVTAFVNGMVIAMCDQIYAKLYANVTYAEHKLKLITHQSSLECATLKTLVLVTQLNAVLRRI